LAITKAIAKEIKAGKVLYDKDIAKVSIVGIGMKTHAGVAHGMFGVLSKNKINIEMISTSEISVSCIIKKQKARQAVRALHKTFGLEKK